jgi:hypothetical protein
VRAEKGELMTSAENLALELKGNNPDLRIGHANGSAVGFFADGRWWPWALATIDGQWIKVSWVPRVNGEDCYKQSDWLEVLP